MIYFVYTSFPLDELRHALCDPGFSRVYNHKMTKEANIRKLDYPEPIVINSKNKLLEINLSGNVFENLRLCL